MSDLTYLRAYPEHLQSQARQWLQQGKLGEMLAEKYPDTATIRSDKALYDYALTLKQQFMRGAPPLHKVRFDNQLQVLHRALGLHTASSRVQGVRLRMHKEIRIAALFKEMPPEFLRMILVHELAHLQEMQHNKPFYQLCLHMEPHYHQYEFDLRLTLTLRDFKP